MTSITIQLPGKIYSANKDAFIKLRGKYDVKNWDGTSWSNPDVLLTTSFQKAALKAGRPHDYDGDILILSGNLNSPFVTELINLSKSIGGTVDKNEVVSNVEEHQEAKDTENYYSNLTLEQRIESELENEYYRLESAGMDSRFIEKWLRVHEKHLRKLYS